MTYKAEKNGAVKRKRRVDPTHQLGFETELVNTVATRRADIKDLTLLLHSLITNRELQNVVDSDRTCPWRYDRTHS